MMSLNDSSEKQPRSAVKSRNENNKGNSVRTRIMKTFQIVLVVAVLSSPALLAAAEPAAGNRPNADDPKATENLPEHTNHPGGEDPQSAPASKPAVGKPSSENGTNLLRMHFRGASLDQVLNYLSEAAGFIINLKPGVSVRG